MMGRTIVTQRSDFECCYIMKMHDELQIHSHHYKIEISVSGDQRMEDNGVILEFSQFKSILDSVLPDHMFIFNSDSNSNCIEEVNVANAMVCNRIPVKELEFSPSAENLVNYIVNEFQWKLNTIFPGVVVVDAKLRESNDSFAQWSK